MASFLSLQDLLLRLIAVAVVFTLKGFIQAWVAARFGDDGPKHDGRLVLNPMQQGTLLGFLSFWLFGIGWTKPMQLEPARLKARGFVAIGLSGILACLVLAFVVAQLRPLLVNAFTSGDVGYVLAVFFNTVVDLSLWCALINCIPIFPLDGFTVLSGFFPNLWTKTQSYLRYLEIGLALAAVSGLLLGLLSPLQQWLRHWVIGS